MILYTIYQLPVLMISYVPARNRPDGIIRNHSDQFRSSHKVNRGRSFRFVDFHAQDQHQHQQQQQQPTTPAAAAGVIATTTALVASPMCQALQYM